jgi:hypothetical protein
LTVVLLGLILKVLPRLERMPVACRYTLRKQAIRASGPVRYFSGDQFTLRLGMEDVMAEALSSKINTFKRFDRMLASAEARRSTTRD